MSGTVVALMGVAAVRLIGPHLSGMTGKVVTVAGYIVSVLGIAVIAVGVKRQAEERITSMPHNVPETKCQR